MKHNFVFAAVLSLGACSKSTVTKTAVATPAANVVTATAPVTENPQYDPELAAKLGADAYGMKSYVFVVLTAGAKPPSDTNETKEAFTGHFANIRRLAQEKKLIVAGPFGKNAKGYRGLFILDVASIEEAELLLATDPAITAGFLQPELYEWYGSAALPEYLPASDRAWQKKPG